MFTDGKDTITWRKFKSALPRFIMAIFIGIVISTPLEMKIFNDRIESQLLKDNIERINSAKSKSEDYTEFKTL
jgi:Na+/glutamate symporter